MKPKQSAKPKKPGAPRKTKTARPGKSRPKKSPPRVAKKNPPPRKPTRRSRPKTSPRPRRRTATKKLSRRPLRKALPVATQLPEILFEGDRPRAANAQPAPALAPDFAAAEAPLTGAGELPEAYGTEQVLVTARDPHWLYVHWDLTREQLRAYNAQSIHKHLVLRLTQPDAVAETAGEVHVHPESRHWFVHVAQAGVRYAVELGYYGKAKGWTSISTSAPTLAPPALAAADTGAKFATIPMDVALAQLVEVVKRGARENRSLAHALEELRLAGHPDIPAVPEGGAPQPWTLEQERALAEVILMRQLGQVAIGSLDITELVRHGLQENFSSLIAALAGGSELASLSSPTGGGAKGPGGFWLNLNAELIIYGATAPDASVTIGGHAVKLRPDGSFSFRFALPDGVYELPVTAVSGDGTEARHADLKFSRATELIGDVGQHPQDPALKTPTPENT